MLNVTHVKNDVKSCPIVTKFGTLIGNMSRTGLYDCHICTIFFVTSFLCSLQFLLFHRIEYPKRCLWKKIIWLSFGDMTVPSKKQCTVPVTLTFDLWILYCIKMTFPIHWPTAKQLCLQRTLLSGENITELFSNMNHDDLTHLLIGSEQTSCLYRKQNKLCYIQEKVNTTNAR